MKDNNDLFYMSDIDLCKETGNLGSSGDMGCSGESSGNSGDLGSSTMRRLDDPQQDIKHEVYDEVISQQ